MRVFDDEKRSQSWRRKGMRKGKNGESKEGK
jgi:hypothetical protein